MNRIRRWLHLDWLCQGCDRLGSRRWSREHECPERDRWEREAQERFSGGPSFLLTGSSSPKRRRSV